MINVLKHYSKSIWFKIGITVLSIFLVGIAAKFLYPVFVAIALAFVLNPVVKFFERVPIRPQIPMPKSLAIIFSFAVFGLFIYAIVAQLIIPLLGEMNKLLANLPILTGGFGSQELGMRFNNAASGSKLPSNLNALVDEGLSYATSYVMAWMKDLVSSTFDMAAHLIGFILVPFLSFYFLKDGEKLRKMTINVFAYDSQALASSILSDIVIVLSAYVRGLFKLCIISAFCIALGTYILGVQFPLVLGFTAILVETIPVVGPILGALPALSISYSQDPMLALKVGIYYFVYYQIDSQVILPKVMGEAIDLHPVLIIVGVFIGGQLFGILGLLFAVPAVAVCKVLYDHLWHMDEVAEIDTKNCED